MSLLSFIAAAGSAGAGGAGLDVDECFSPHLYDGTGSAQTITNGIDLSGEGGLVWIKERTSVGALGWHSLFDTERGTSKYLSSNNTNAEGSSAGVTAFNSNGFTLGDTGLVNQNNGDFVSWSFRKAPKFFDVISIDVADPEPTSVTVNHNLGQEVGMVIMKPYLHTYPWYVWHRSLNANKYLELNTTAAEASFGGTGFSSTSTTITIPGMFVHSGSSNGKCILYLFAHNNNDGGFGPDGDQDIIKCGSYAAATQPNFINVGFEPQWLLIKNITTTVGDWYIYDSMRGVPTGSGDKELEANDDAAEAASSGGGQDWVDFNATGFTLKDNWEGVNQSGKNYIYMAIRRGSLFPPEDATKVFFQSTASAGTALSVGFVPDFWLGGNRNGGASMVMDRLRGSKYMSANSTAAEQNTNGVFSGATTNTFTNNAAGGSRIEWLWKRAPSYFDVVAYSGDGSPNDQAPTLTHNLGAVPEMVWCKRRNNTSNWAVSVKLGTGGVQAYLDANNGNVGTLATTGPSNTWSDYFTSTQVIGDGGSGNQNHGPFPVTNLNASGNQYIMYLFATAPGVSKVGSYTGNDNGSNSQTIDCGFSSGARFVLIKRYDGSGDWYVFDTVRGINTGDDPYLLLNTNGAEQTVWDGIDPHSSGFSVTSSTLNTNGSDYIFYAIA